MNKKVMVCIDLNENSLNLFREDLKKWNWKDVEEVHFVHGFQLQTYADAFCLVTYPPDSAYEQIKESTEAVLQRIEDEAKKIKADVKTDSKCLIVTSPKQALAEYAISKDIDQMVIGTREKHDVSHFFSSSFAEYMVGHAPCELRILRF